jgi:hypothetical protein
MLCPKCQNDSVPFVRFWLTSGFETQTCQNCGAICRVKKSPIFLVISFSLALLMVIAAVIGLVLNNWFFVIIPIIAICVDPLVYRCFRRLELATSPKRVQTPLLILLIVGVLILIFYFVNLSAKNFRAAESYRIDHEFHVVANQLKDKPGSVERSEEFVQRCKAINTYFAPPEVKNALNDYIAAVEQSTLAIKAGRDSVIFHQKTSEQYQKLKSTFAKYEQPSAK